MNRVNRNIITITFFIVKCGFDDSERPKSKEFPRMGKDTRAALRAPWRRCNGLKHKKNRLRFFAGGGKVPFSLVRIIVLGITTVNIIPLSVGQRCD